MSTPLAAEQVFDSKWLAARRQAVDRWHHRALSPNHGAPPLGLAHPGGRSFRSFMTCLPRRGSWAKFATSWTDGRGIGTCEHSSFFFFP